MKTLTALFARFRSPCLPLRGLPSAETATRAGLKFSEFSSFPVSGFLLCVFCFQLSVLPCSAEDDTFGFSKVPIRENSDNYIPVPYAKTPLWTGTLASGPSVDGNLATLTLPDCPAPTVPCYVRFRSGPLAGRYYHTTSGSTEGSIIVNTNGDNQIALAEADDEAALITFWTLAELLPPGGLPFPTTDTGMPYLFDLQGVNLWGHQAYGLNTSSQWVDGAWQYATWNPNNSTVSVLFPNHTAAGINLPLQNQCYPSYYATAYFWGSPYYEDGAPAEYLNYEGMTVSVDPTAHWLDGFGNCLDDTIIPPDGFVVLRNAGGDATLTLYGYNEPGPLVTTASTLTTGSQDNYLSIPIVRPTTLAQLITGEGFWGSANSFMNQRKDSLYLWWPGGTGFFRPPVGAYYKITGDSWKLHSTGLDNADNTVIPPHTLFLLRKKTTPDGATSFLKVNPSN